MDNHNNKKENEPILEVKQSDKYRTVDELLEKSRLNLRRPRAQCRDCLAQRKA